MLLPNFNDEGHDEEKSEIKTFSDFDDAILANELGIVDLRVPVLVRDHKGTTIKTSVGRIIFNKI